jgi:hypothetical protein
MMRRMDADRIMQRLPHRLVRHVFNWWPAIRGTGARVTYVAPDWSELRVRLPRNLRTRNYVGTTFGGSMYGAVDPFQMLLLMRRLGPGYVVWDKSATIRFRRPGRSTLHATFRLDDAELAEVRAAVDAAGRLDRSWTIELVDDHGVVHATVEKVLYLATAAAHAERRAAHAGAARA